MILSQNNKFLIRLWLKKVKKKKKLQFIILVAICTKATSPEGNAICMYEHQQQTNNNPS